MDNGHEPATKAEVAKLDRRLDEVLESLRDVETKLLSAFYGYAKTRAS